MSKIRIPFPNLGNNPWNILNENEKKEIDEFLDQLIPVPKYDTEIINDNGKVHRFTNAKEIIQFVRKKTSQMDSFRAMQSFWPFDNTLINKLKNIFAQLDKRKKALKEYGTQCCNIIDNKYKYISSPQKQKSLAPSPIHNNNKHNQNNDKREMDDDDNDNYINNPLTQPESTHNNNTYSQTPKQQQKPIKNTSYSPQPSIANLSNISPIPNNISNVSNINPISDNNNDNIISPIGHNNNNNNNNIEADLEFLNENHDIFTNTSINTNQLIQPNDNSQNTSNEMKTVEQHLSQYNISDTNCDINNTTDRKNSSPKKIKYKPKPKLKGGFIDLTQETTCTKPIITPKPLNNNSSELNSLLKCPLCNALFDTPIAIRVHIDNDHNEKNSPSPKNKYPSTQPIQSPTPILHKRRRRKNRPLILSGSITDTSPLIIKKKRRNKKRKLSDISNDSSDIIKINAKQQQQKKKRRKISELTCSQSTNTANKNENDSENDNNLLRREDYEIIEAVHSDNGNISEGNDDDDGGDCIDDYDLDDSFINNNTQTPITTQAFEGYRKALKTPKHLKDNINRVFGKNVKNWIENIDESEEQACSNNYIEQNHTFIGMEQYEDPNDPILPVYDAEKEGMFQYQQDTESDDDELNIRQRMRRPMLEQTQQLISISSENKNIRKRKYSDITNNSNIDINVSQLNSCSQKPKRRKLKKPISKDSPFFTQQPSHPNNNNNNNTNNNNNIDSELEFLNANHDMFANSSFYHEPQEYLPDESPMLVRTRFKSNNKNKNKSEQNENDSDQSDDEMPEKYLTNLDGITWENLVTRECDNIESNDCNNPNMTSTDDLLTPELTPKPYSEEMATNYGNPKEIKMIMDAQENMKVSKVNELLRNKYKIRPIIRTLDFVQYVIGDSIAIIRRKEKDMVKGEQITILKSILHRATDRYKQIIFILHRMDRQTKHRTMGIGAAKKLDKNIQQITLSNRIDLVECLESEQVAETIVYYLKKYAKYNKNNVIGVPICKQIENMNDNQNENDNINEKKLLFLVAWPQIGYSEAIWLLKEFNYSIANIINATAIQLGNAVPSLKFNDRHLFIKTLMTHKWKKNKQDEKHYDSYMELSSAVKLRKSLSKNIENKNNNNNNDIDIDNNTDNDCSSYD